MAASILSGDGKRTMELIDENLDSPTTNNFKEEDYFTKRDPSIRRSLATAPPRFPHLQQQQHDMVGPLATSPAASPMLMNSGRIGTSVYRRTSVASKMTSDRENPNEINWHANSGLSASPRGLLPQTAPASLGLSKSAVNASPYLVSTLSPSTRKQNHRLASILSIINAPQANHLQQTHHYNSPNRAQSAWTEDARSFNDFSSAADYHAAFERNLQDIYRLLEVAKGFSDRGHKHNEDDPSATGMSRDAEHPANVAGASTIAQTPGATAGPRRRRDVHAGELAESPTRRTAGALPSPSSPVPAGSPIATDSQNIESRALAGRKPLRAIMQDLAKRIQALKTNPPEWEALQMKIAAYRYSRNSTHSAHDVDVVTLNKRRAKTLYPKIKHEALMDRKAKNEQHRNMVLAKKHELDEKIQKRKITTLQLKDDTAAQYLTKEGASKIQIMQTKWLTIVIVASRISAIKKIVENAHSARTLQLERTHAAIVIQRAYRAWQHARLLMRRRQALRMIAKTFQRFYPVWKRNKLREASNTIQSFFKEAYDVSKLLKIVKKYHLSVIKAQRCCKSILQIRSAQVTVLTLYWDRLESLWRSQRARGSQNELDDKKSKKKKKGKKDDSNEKSILKCSDVSKHKLLFDNLLLRKGEYRKAVEEYEAAMTTYNEDLKKRLIIASDNGDATAKTAPKMPFFKLLPAASVMFQLMEAAILADTAEAQGQ